MSSNKERLLEIILERSFKYSKEPIFKLQSGKMSQYYIDLKQSTLYPESLALIAKEVFELVKNENIQGIGGLTLGADPIALATALEAQSQGASIAPFIVRKQAKGHGTGKKIEATFSAPASIYVLDDVITTGGSTIQALDACKEAGFDIKGVICVVDREEGGKEKIENDYKIPVYSLFNKSQLFKAVNAD